MGPPYGPKAMVKAMAMAVATMAIIAIAGAMVGHGKPTSAHLCPPRLCWTSDRVFVKEVLSAQFERRVLLV